MTENEFRQLQTPSGKPFRAKGGPGEEIIVYPSDRQGRPQEAFALVITPFEARLVLDFLEGRGQVPVGASRDRPPRGSLGELLKSHKLTPQHLSYLLPVLEEAGLCRVTHRGKAGLEFGGHTRIAVDGWRTAGRAGKRW